MSRDDPEVDAARGYVGSSIVPEHLAGRVPELDEPLVVSRRYTVRVAERA